MDQHSSAAGRFRSSPTYGFVVARALVAFPRADLIPTMAREILGAETDTADQRSTSFLKGPEC